jgi:hypothetical protein
VEQHAAHHPRHRGHGFQHHRTTAISPLQTISKIHCSVSLNFSYSTKP